MMSSQLFCAALLALLSVVSGSTTNSYKANTNTNCGTASDVDYQATYYYLPTDTMDWGFYARTQGTCDSGSSAKVTLKDPVGNELDCGYLSLDGNLNLVSCSNYPRGYMTEGQYTLIIDTVPGANQYSWNQFTVIHSQSTVTASTPTSTVTTTPISLQTATVISTPTTTQYNAQKTVTITTASVTQFVTVTPAVATTTSTSTRVFGLPVVAFATTSVTVRTTAPCYHAGISVDLVKLANGQTGFFGSSILGLITGKNIYGSTFKFGVRSEVLEMIKQIHQIRRLRLRDDVPNTVGMPGLPPTTTIIPNAVIQTSTAATVTSTITSTSTAPAVAITSNNPTPTVTAYKGVGCSAITTTLPQSTKTVINQKWAVTIFTNTVTLTHTNTVVTTPVCKPTYK